MDEYCPLCRKMGNNKRIKAFQFSFDEAVWLCEDEGCPWPFGYEEFRFLPRTMEDSLKKSPSKTDLRRRKESTSSSSISPGLGVYTPPMTPSSDGSSKDSGKIDSSGQSINNFTGKISPNLPSSTITTAQLIKRENSKSSGDNLEKQPVTSIFDIDSSIPVAKIEILTVENGTNSSNCGHKTVRDGRRPRILKKGLKSVPLIRSIETIPNNSIKIEVKEDSLINFVNDNVSDDKNRLTTSAPRIKRKKRPSEARNLDSIDEVPKKILGVSDSESDQGILPPEMCTAQPEIQSQSNNFLDIMNFEAENAAIENSAHVSLNGILDEMLMADCQNVTQEIDDDWLNSMLV